MELFKISGVVDINNQNAISQLDQTNNKASQVSQQMAQKFESIGTAFSKIGDKMSKAGTILTSTLTLGIGGLATAGLKYNMQMEDFQMNLTTLLGDSDKATKLLNDLQSMASTTPFETTDLISATETMIGFGISAQDSQKYLSMIGDIAMGDSEKLSGLSLAFSQVQSTGKLTGQDLLQMINQGFNPLKYISEQTGKSMSQLKEEMGEGKISAKMVGDAFEYATSKGQPFYKGMENGAKTVSGRISTLKDNFMILIGSLTESLLPVFEKVVDYLTKLTEKFSNLSDEQKENILKWTGIVAAIGPALIIFGKLTSGLGSIFSIIGKVKGMGGIAGLTAKFQGLLPVIGPVVGVIAGVVGGIALLVHVLGGPKEALEKLKQAFEWCKDVIQDFLDKINFQEKLEGIKKKFSELSEKLKGLKDLFKVIGTIIGGSLSVAFGVLSGLFNGVITAIGPLLDALGGIIDILAGIGNFIVGVFTGDMEKIKEGLGKVKDGIVAVFSGLWETVKGLLGGFLEGIWSFFTSLSDKIGLTDFLINVKNKISEWWTNFVTWIQEAWTNICAFFSTIATWINDNIVQPIINFFKSLWDGVKAVWDGICLAIEIAIKLIVSIIDAAFQLITLPFRFIWENCKETIMTVWNAISSFISTIINTIKNVITTVFNSIKNFFTTVWNGIKNIFTTVWSTIVNFITPIINSIKNTITTVFNAIKSFVTTVWNGIKSVTTSVWNAIVSVVTNVTNKIKSVVTSVFDAVKNTVSNVWNGIKNTVSNVVNGIKNTVSNVFNSVKSTVSNVWNGILNAIKTPINKAKDTVKGAIDKIKGFFKFKFEWPKLKMPHFGISPKGWKIGDLLEGKIPKLAIDWYAKAMDNGMVLDEPTIFGLNKNGQPMAGGEAGSETIVGTNSLMGMIQSSVRNQNLVLESKVETLIDILLQYMPMLANRQLCLDSGELVGALTTKIDRSLGDLTDKRARGR